MCCRWQSKANFIYKATKQHALNLARFVAIYKTALLAQKTMSGGKERASDTFFAGLLSGWFVFGERNAVNEQVRPHSSIFLDSYTPGSMIIRLPRARLSSTSSLA